MEYKVITSQEAIKVSGAFNERQPVEKIDEYIKQGYKILNASYTHELRQDVTMLDVETKPTQIFVFGTYLLFKDETLK